MSYYYIGWAFQVDINPIVSFAQREDIRVSTTLRDLTIAAVFAMLTQATQMVFKRMHILLMIIPTMLAPPLTLVFFWLPFALRSIYKGDIKAPWKKEAPINDYTPVEEVIESHEDGGPGVQPVEEEDQYEQWTLRAGFGTGHYVHSNTWQAPKLRRREYQEKHYPVDY